MRILPKQYAAALVDSIKTKDKKEVSLAIENFCRLLAENNHLFLAEKIIVEFERLWNFSEGIVEAEIISAKDVDSNTQKNIEEYILKTLSAKKIYLKKSIDTRMLGGVVIKFEDKIIDGSLSTKLKALKNEMKK